MTKRSQDKQFVTNEDALRGERMMTMFKTIEELTRFGESARQLLAKSVARWMAAATMAALVMSAALVSAFVSVADLQAFLSAYLVAE